MRLRHGDAPLARHLAVAGLVLLVVGLWWLRRFPEAPGDLIPACTWRTLTDLACPTCGGTRAMLALSQGQPLVALNANPLVTMASMAFGLWAIGGLVATLVPRWRRTIEAAPGDGRRLVSLAVVVILASWLWVATS